MSLTSDDSLVASGGNAGPPLTPRYDVFSTVPSQERVDRMRRAICREQLQVCGSLYLTNTFYKDTYYNTIGSLFNAMAEGIITEFDRYTVEDAMPVVSAPRGGIAYFGVDGKPIKPTVMTRLRKARRKVSAWRKRTADALAVYRGDKDAYSEEEWEEWRYG